MLQVLLIFLLSLIVLLAAAHFFTNAAQRVGLALGMAPFVVGVFIVAIGTSLPELVASLLSVRAGASEIVAGNVLGANAANLLLVLGAVSVAVPRGQLVLGEQYLFIDLHFLIGSISALATTMYDGDITRVEGALLLAAYVVYVSYLIAEGRTPSAEATHAESLEEMSAGRRQLLRDAAILVVSAVAIYLGGERTVSSLTRLASALGIAPAIASVAILSIGTTLPELAISVTAARNDMASLAVGNILGSCVFNALAVAGASASLGGVRVPSSILGFVLPFVAAASLLFYLFTQDKRLSRWEGLLSLVLFVLFMNEVVSRG